jgi:hypothetical protein
MADAPPLWSELADFLCGPLTGFALLAELRARFPHATRDDVYRAIAFAWTYHTAGELADRLELEALRPRAEL